MKKTICALFLLSALLAGIQLPPVLHAQSSAPMDIQATWQGVLETPMGKLSLVFRIAKAGADSWSALMDSPDQGARDIPCSSVTCAGRRIVIEVNSIGLTVSGRLNDAGDELKGTLNQSGMDFPVSLRRIQSTETATALGEKAAGIPPPLLPLGDDVQVDTGTGVLSGSLLVPDSMTAKTVVLIIAGSGPTDRDGNSTMLNGPNHSLRLLAEALSKSGIASLRYDKRGIARSAAAGRVEADLDFDDYIADAVAWLGRLRRDGRFSKVGILGHSEGALIGMVAANRGRSDFFISVAGPGRPFDRLLLEQLAAQSKPMHDAAQVYVAKLKEGQTIPDVPESMRVLFRPSVQPFLISLFKYDPLDEIRKLTVPVLLIQGNTDLQIPVRDAELLKQAKTDARLKIIDGMNHVLKDSPLDRARNMAAYTDPSLPLAKGFAVEIINFLTQL